MDKQQIQEIKEDAASRGLGDIAEVLHEADILHAGWEMDNKAWIAKTVSGKVVALTTDHGGMYAWDRAEAEEKLAETEASAASIRRALELWPADEG